MITPTSLYAKFTFQYVSINTVVNCYTVLRHEYLHSNMFLLIQGSQQDPEDLRAYLHSNMFLLIREHAESDQRETGFTFQYVSINTECFAVCR